MSNEVGKLFVGGLSFDTTEETLTEAFEKYGAIERVDVIRDRETGRSRGFGFVTFADPADAKDALEGMNGKVVDNRTIRVDEAGKGGRYSGQSGSRRGGFYGSRGRGFSRGGYYGYDRGSRSGDTSFGDGRGYSRGYRDYRGEGGYDRSGTNRDSSYSYSGHD